MATSVDLLSYATQVLFVGLAVACAVRWRRRGGRPAGWLALAFGAVGAVTVLGTVTPDPSSSPLAAGLGKLFLAAILLFPYLLFRFVASLQPFPRWAALGAHTLTATVIVAALALPTLPADTRHRPGWAVAFLVAVLIQWTALSLLVSLRLWVAGGDQPRAVVYRVRGLSLGAAGLSLAVVLSAIAGSNKASLLGLVTQLVSLLSITLFVVALSPPALLRDAWRRPAEQALRRAMAEFMSATEVDQVAACLLPHLTAIAAGRGAALLDPSGRIVRVHQVSPAAAQAVADQDEAGSAAGTGSSVLRLPLSNGSLLVWTSPYAPVFGEHDLEVLHSLGTLADLALERVTGREAAEEQRRESELLLSSVVENLPHMVCVKRADDLSFVRFNRAAEEVTGHRRDEVLGRTDHDLYAADLADAAAATDRRALAGNEVLDLGEEQLATADGAIRTLHTKKIPLFGTDGRPRYLLGISEDITERKQAEEELARAHELAERANQAKTVFVSRMSHELRTPLNAILGFAQLLELDLPAEHLENVVHIRKAGAHLLALINEVLDISRIETGHLALSPEPVQVSEVLEEALDLIRPLADARGLTLAADPTSSCRRQVVADRQRIKQVLLNLLSNAVKYNREGGSVNVTCGPAVEAGPPRLAITVRDTGVGIAPTDLHRLFTPFDRLGAEGSDIEGTGVGLALSLRLVEAMGGELTVSSTPGQGSAFTVSMALVDEPLLQVGPPPLRRGSADEVTGEASGQDEPAESRLRLLCIEDNASNVRLVEGVTGRRPDWRLLHAGNARTGLELAASWAAGPGLHLILLDLHLPDMHGYDLLRQLRANTVTSETPVVVLSADATPGQVRRLLDAGADRYLTKPFDVADLLGILDQVAAGDRPRGEDRDAVAI